MIMKPSDTLDDWTDTKFSIQHIIKNLLFTILFNFIIAGFLYTTDFFHAPFVSILIISQSIGISICLTIGFSFRLFKPKDNRIQLLVLLSAIVLGTVTGLVIGVFLSGQDTINTFSIVSYLFKSIVLGLFFGLIISNFFISRHKLSYAASKIQEERLKRMTTEKQAAETQLKLLQAQIEPHFLFNTLSTIISLLETDVAKGKTMLLDLTHYLRAALDKSRSSRSTLGQEIKLIQAYVQIHAIRMGERLTVDIHLPENLKTIPFPPMLIQPLVENALKHGLDPLIDGGSLTISACKIDDLVQIRISDTGKGLSKTSGKGVGLANIQQRLESIYGDNGRLVLQENEGPGLTAILEVPVGPST